MLARREVRHEENTLIVAAASPPAPRPSRDGRVVRTVEEGGDEDGDRAKAEPLAGTSIES